MQRRRTADQREMREALSAIRSLCEVALGGNSGVTEEDYAENAYDE